MRTTLKTTNKVALILMTMFLSSIMMVSAQNPDNVMGLTAEKLRPQFTNLTPEAASLGKFGAFQVSEYSGAANISIPLYTVNSGDVSFPITLYYDATGIKVEQDATMVGLGWNLSYGGMISHIVQGEDDFHETSHMRNANYYKNFWNNPYPHDQPSEQHFQYKVGMGVSFGGSIGDMWYPFKEDEWQFWGNLAQGYDTPDVFQANFCGHNLSFVIDCRHNFKIKILNEDSRKYKITYTSDGEPNYYPRTFTITDDKGISYQFSPYAENVNRLAITNIDSYYLTKIYGPDGLNGKSVVDIQYDQFTAIYEKDSRPRSKEQISNARRIKSSNDIISGSFDAYISVVGHNSYYQDIGCFITGESYKVYPKMITTALETIEFERKERNDIKGAMSISGITIKPQSGNSEKKISFAYDYFHEDSPKSDYSGTRLKLTGVTINDQEYKFEYDNNKIPAFSSYSKDYWGYYNGANPKASNFTACTPAYTISNGVVKPAECLDGSNRLASEELCKVGMLKKVIYPTGGYTVYEYETNRFNDQYYYPDASDKITFPAADSTYYDGGIFMNGTKTQTMTFKASQSDCNLAIGAKLCNQSENLTVTIKNNSDSIVKTVTYKGSKEIGDTIALSLTKDSTYTVEAELNATQANSTSTVAQVEVSHDVANTNITASPSTKDENGGYSIGGGLRVRTIKNYDSDGTYLNGVKYEYSGGKLLSPTVQLEKHSLDFAYQYKSVEMDFGDYQEYGISRTEVRFSFYYANTEPSYPYICYLGIPATVGYDQVIKKEIDKSGNVLRKTVYDFYNYGYVADDEPTNQINSRMQNSFFFNSYYNSNSTFPQGHLNGKIKKERIYNGTVLASTTQYEYGSIRQGFVQYPKCFPLYLKGYICENMIYDFAIYTHFNMWSYLTSKTETLYDSNGKPLSSNTTQYNYNSSNYQLSQQTVSNGVDSVRTNYWYPSDEKVEGYDELKKIHNISEVTAIDTYRNGTFTGGNKYSYAKKYSSATKKYFPVVYRCFSVLPNESKSSVIEMTVTSWDGYGNIREYQKKDGTPVTVIWSYNHQLPIMEIVGCKYADACKLATSIPTVESQTNVSDNTIASIHSKLQNDLKDAYVTAYIYGPWHTVTQIIKPNGEKIQYCYDDYGRLKETKDVNDKTLQKYFYNYKNK